MRYETVESILMKAQENQQHGVIKTHNDSVCFSFANGDSSEDYIIAYDSRAEVVSVLGKVCNSYVDCEAIECIEVYKQH